MLMYAAVALMPITLSVFFNNLNAPKRKRSYLIVCGVLLFLFMALRHPEVGSSDTVNYVNMLRKAIQADSWAGWYNKDGVESGFQLLVYILSRVVGNGQWIIVVSSAIFVASIMWTISRYSQDVPLSITLYITLGMMTFQMQGMRQAIAMCLGLLAYEMAMKQKFWLFALILALAVTFHQTAIILAPMYVLPRVKFKAFNLLLILAAFLIVFAMSSQVVNFANDLFEMDYGTAEDSGGYFTVAAHVCILLLAFICNKKMLEQNTVETTAFFVALIGCAFFIMRYFATQAIERVSFYFLFGEIILLPNTLQQLRTEERQGIKAVVYTLAIGLYLYHMSGSEFDPYMFYWQ